MSDELQLSHTAGTTDVPLLDQTIPDNLDATVARFGDREALVDVQQGIRWTYREFSDRVTGLARGLLAAGVATGDRVGIWAPNCAEWTLTQYATARIGASWSTSTPATAPTSWSTCSSRRGSRSSWRRRSSSRRTTPR